MLVARAPGKLVALGEYAVLDGAPAVVLALDRYAEAAIAPSPDGRCRLTMRTAEVVERGFAAGETSGEALVDSVTAAAPTLAWSATLDTQAFFAAGTKLGLGSSAAVLTAWAGAFAAFARAAGAAVAEPRVEELIALHRRFQGGQGSGLDVAASYTGGAITFSLGGGSRVPQIGSVRLPNSVGFAGIFAGRSASTPALVAHYRAWRRDRPREATALVRRLTAQAEAGCAALRGDDAAGWLEAFAAYGRSLQELGEAIGVAVVTAEHHEIGVEAQRHGVAYKVSGAGGGDLGLACAADLDRLEAFRQSVSHRGFRVINVSLAEHGLLVAHDGAGWQR